MPQSMRAWKPPLESEPVLIRCLEPVTVPAAPRNWMYAKRILPRLRSHQHELCRHLAASDGGTLKTLLLVSLSGTLPSFTTISRGDELVSNRTAALDLACTSTRLVTSPSSIRKVTGTSAPASPRLLIVTVKMEPPSTL